MCKRTFEEYQKQIGKEVEDKLSVLLEDSELGNVDELMEVLRYGTVNQGKRLRPVLAVLTADTFSNNDDKSHSDALDVGTGCELLHQSSIMIDDIVDREKDRRKKPSVQEAYGIGMGVIGSGKLLTMSLRLGVGKTHEVMSIMLQAFENLMESVVMEKKQCFSKEWYYSLCDKKTAFLFSSAIQIGTIVSTKDKVIRSGMTTAGYHLGCMYQILDDYVDVYKYVHNNSKEGDMVEQKIGMPMIILAQDSDVGEGTKLFDRFKAKLSTDDDLELITEYILDSDTLERTLELAKIHRDMATTLLGTVLIDNEYGDYLKQVPQFMYNSMLSEL